ncbi:MAG: FitA-like ribbon-helix-helix domain-containing protein [Longimicrobiaceae bacterium]
MTLKNVPEDLYAELKLRAERHRRSMNSEAIVCLERALHSEKIDPERLLAEARELRSRIPGVFVTDADLRSARDSGRP